MPTDLRSQLISDLPGACSRGEIVAFYQPQVDADERQVVAAEALSRWFHPLLGLIAPDIFIPLAEETGIIDEIGDFMLGEACEFAAAHGRDGTPIDVAVNVSAVQLRDEKFAVRVLDTLHRHGLSPKYLTLEVTESTAIQDVLAVAERLDGLRSVGVIISVDDFGTGHSSVDQLLGLHATELKIDQSLVQNDARPARTLLAAVVGFAHDKGLRVVAEGVETAAQFAAVTSLGCDRVQGYFIGKAMPESEFHELLGATR